MDDKTYGLHVYEAGFDPYNSARLRYHWACKIGGKWMTCQSNYTSKKGALAAGRNWLKKNIHDKT